MALYHRPQDWELPFVGQDHEVVAPFKYCTAARHDKVIAATDQHHSTLEVGFDKAIEALPFAALRSMYVTDVNNDAQEVAVREAGAKGWREDKIMAFGHAAASAIWVGRVSPSRHNTSSPDMVFNAFAGN